MPNFWQTSRIRLRAIEPGDAETFYRWNQDSERARTLDFLWPPTSLESQKAFADAASKRRPENDAYQWIIESIESDPPVPIGTIDVHHTSQKDGTFMYGVDIAAPHRCKGFAAEAIRLVLHYYFNELRYQKCTVEVHADNPASLRLHEKLGFLHEGLLRRMVFTGGAYVDVVMMGITKEEFGASQQSTNHA